MTESKTEKHAKGLLLAMMEPTPAADEEFNAWYDTEHQPGRQAIPGFINARRFVCVDGWPRYLAIYDLDTLAVLKSDAYLAAAFQRFSNWGKRVLSSVIGQFRGEGIQIYPGQALYGDQGVCSRLIMWRFRQPPQHLIQPMIDGLRAIYERKPEYAQLRVFRSDYDNEPVFIALIEARAPTAPPSGPELAGLGSAANYIDLVNTYVPYFRATKLHGIQR